MANAEHVWGELSNERYPLAGASGSPGQFLLDGR